MPDRPSLPFVDIKNWSGLFTKSSTDVLSPEQLRIAENVDFFRVYGALSKLRGSKNILSAPYQEKGIPRPISWVGFYKAADLSGIILRHVLAASGTKITRLNGNVLEDLPNTSDGTFYTGGRTENISYTFDQLDRFLYLTNFDPDRPGVGDKLLKYDGDRISNWGLTAPGLQDFIVEPFSDIAGFTAIDCDIFNDPDVSFDGSSIRLTQTGGISCSIEKTITPFKISNDGRKIGLVGGLSDERLAFWLFIPRGQLDNANTDIVDPDSNTAKVLSVSLGSDSSNFWRFDYQKGDLNEGWNLVRIDVATAIKNGGPVRFGDQGFFNPESVEPFGHVVGNWDPDPAGADEPVSYLKFEFFNSGTPLSNLRLDRFVRRDQGTPAAQAFGTGTFSGNYQWRVSFVSKFGNESNIGPRSTSIFAGNNAGFYLFYLPISEDKQIVARRVYRTVAGGTVFLRLTEIPNNTLTTLTDDIPDGSLSEVTAPQAGDFSDDNSPPPKGGIVKIWKRTMFMAGDPQNPNTLFFSEDDDPESFPIINAFDLDDKITAIYETFSGLVVETETAKWQVIGDNPDYAVDKVIENMGCVGRRAAGTTKLLGYSVDRDGLRLYDLSDTSKISEPIRDKYEDLNKENIEHIHTVHSRSRNSLIQFNPGPGPVNKFYPANFDSIFHFQYAVDDSRTGWWSTINTPSSLNFLDAEEVEDTNGDFRIYAGSEGGQLVEIITTDHASWYLSDTTREPIVTVFQSPYIRLGGLGSSIEGVTGKVEPTYLEVRHEGDATTWIATIDMAKGPDQAQPSTSVTIPFVFGSNNSLLRKPIKFGVAVRDEYARITLKNSDLDVKSTISAVKMYFHVREGQYPVTDIKSIS